MGQPSTRLVGRQHDLLQVEALLDAGDARLVTVVGPGGVGKTRLAHALLERAGVDDSGIFVAMADVGDAALMPGTILRTLGMTPAPGQTIEEALVAGLQDRPRLLVLDNLEHLAAAAAVGDLLERCPTVRILATSRLRIGVPGERTHALAPLEVPNRASATGVEAAAVELFVERVRLVLPDFQLTPGNVLAAIDICRSVDGLPLAIELAAAQCRQLAPHVLAARLAERAALLAGGPADAPPRHQSMQATLEWSAALLEPPVADLWRALSVFEGGFTLEAADAVAAAIGVPSTQLPAMLDELEIHHLVQLGANALGEPRYSMLRVTREVAVAAMAVEPTYMTVLEAHADAVARCCAEAQPGLVGADGPSWFARVEAEMPNIRAVLARDLAAGRIVRPLAVSTHLHWFWTDPGYVREGSDWMTRLLAAADDTVPIALRRAALTAASAIAGWLDDTAASLAAADQALALARQEGDRVAEMEVMLHLGNVHLDESDLAIADAHFRAGHALALELREAWHAAAFSNLRATVAAADGDLVAAAAWHRAAMAGFRSSGHRSYLAVATTGLGVVLAQLGELDEATAALLDAVPLIDRAAVSPEATVVLTGAATVAIAVGMAVHAVRFLGAATHLRSRLGFDFRPYYLDGLRHQMAALQGELSTASYGQAWNEGATLSLGDALDMAGTFLEDRPRLRLTGREREVLQLLVEGASDAEIAARLYISRHTASKHVAAILTKLAAPNRTTAVALAYRRGLVTP